MRISLLVLVASTSASATTLSDAAAATQPGTFRELTSMTGWNNGAILNPTELGCSNGDWITQYANKAAWDPVRGELRFLGAAHGNCYGAKFVGYSDATNTWSALPFVPGICQSASGCSSTPFSHAYEHNTVDPATGDHYYRQYGSYSFYRFRNGAWTQLPSPTQAGTQVCCSAIEFFPDMNALLWWDTQAGLWAFDATTSQWRGLANAAINNNTPSVPNLSSADSLGYFAQYSPTVKAVLLGDAARHLWKVAANGTITRLADAPITTGVARGVGTGAQLTVDPVTGAFIFITDAAMYEYDLAADTWEQLTVPTRPAFFDVGTVMESLVSAPISNYGVILYFKSDDSSHARVWLYRHAAGTGQPIDAGMSAADAGTPDAGARDAGTLDSGTPDAGAAAAPDAGSPTMNGPPAGMTGECGCRGAPGLATLVALLLIRRRRGTSCAT